MSERGSTISTLMMERRMSERGSTISMLMMARRMSERGSTISTLMMAGRMRLVMLLLSERGRNFESKGIIRSLMLVRLMVTLIR